MKAEVDQKLLTRVLRRCALSGGANLNPVHALVKIQLKPKPASVAFTATAGHMQIDTSVAASVSEEGTLAANARALLVAADSMPLGAIRITADDRRVRLTGSNGRTWSGPVGDPNTIGPTPYPEGLSEVKIPVADLSRLLDRVVATTSDIRDEEERAGYNGVRFEVEREKLTLIGMTRRIVIAIDSTSDVGITAPSWKELVPTKALGALRDLIEEATEAQAKTLSFFSDTRALYIVGPATLVVAMLPVDPYPPWETLLSNFPKEPHATLARLGLIESLKACRATSSKLDPSALFSLGGGEVTVLRRDPDNEFRDAVPAISMRPALQLLMKVETGYLISALTNADEDPDLSLGDDGSAILLRTGSGYRALVALMGLSAADKTG